MSITSSGTSSADNLDDSLDIADVYYFAREGDDTIKGGSGSDSIDGGLDNDDLDGGDGDDDLDGGDGDDDLYGSDGDDDLDGSDGDDSLDGGDGDDDLLGGDGDDTLVGGSGDDDLRGGTGDDVYYFDSLSDTMFESANQGIDTLKISAINTLTAGQVVSLLARLNVENVDISDDDLEDLDVGGNTLNNVLTGNSADNDIYGYTGKDSLHGGSGDDSLDGGIGDDSLDGGNGDDTLVGGTGIDTMSGGAGDDVYMVDNISDDINDDIGIDEVHATVSYSIANDVALDHLVLLGAAAINATGNGLDNRLVGNSGNNILDGGAGIDDMRGGKGNDTYLSHDNDDSFSELDNEGIDTIRLASDFSFAVGELNTVSVRSHIENIDGSKLIDVAFDLVGSTSANLLTGNNDNNHFDGREGNDTMVGGAGDDDFSGHQGVDSLVGGIGDDNYSVNLKFSATGIASLEDIIVESALSTGGDDTVRLNGAATLANPTSTIILAAGLENLYANTTGLTKLNLTGNIASNHIEGNGTGNFISGLTGVDTLHGGAGDDTLSGGLGDDNLDGGLDDDSLDGGAGVDSLTGGAGDDSYTVDLLTTGTGINAVSSLQDSITESLDEGTDSLNLRGTAVLTNASTFSLIGTNLEHLNASATGSSKLNLTGNAAANKLTGNAAANNISGDIGDDSLNGGLGNDTLSGGVGDDSLDGGMGNDTMSGGIGDDIYIVNSLLDSITEDSDGGIDEVHTSVTRTLGDNLENITLTGVAVINATGNAVDNTLKGNAAANILDGKAGKDDMHGGKGADTYIVDDIADSATEEFTIALGGGIDLVKSSASNFTLGANVENLTLTDGTLTGGTDALNGSGNMLNNVIIGNAGANMLFGDAGIDTLTGNAGNDSLNGGAGNDAMTGGLGDDSLDGGLGNDNMNGGAGNDYYYTDSTLDVMTEALNGGIDTVESIVTRTLSLYFEHLVLAGTASINGLGNTLANNITGNSSNNILSGLVGNDTLNGHAGNDILIGGLGADSLTGGLGADRFDLKLITESTGSNVDTISDFSSLDFDKIDLSTIDAKTGVLGNNAFEFIGNDVAFGNVAGQLRFDTANKTVFGDVNGDGVADFSIVLTGVISLAATDFIL